jgi:hypothetical protein
MARKTRRRRIKRNRRVKGVKGTRRVRRYYRGGMEIPPFMTDAFNKVKTATDELQTAIKARLPSTSTPPSPPSPP